MKNSLGRDRTAGTLLILWLVLVSRGLGGVPSGDSAYVLAGKIYPGARHRAIETGGMLIRDGRIVRLDGTPKPPAHVRIIDARGKTIVPGMIDAHSHLGFGREDLTVNPPPAPAWRAPLPESMKPYYLKRAPAPPEIEAHSWAGSALSGREPCFRGALAEGVLMSKVVIPAAGPAAGTSSLVRTGVSGSSGFIVRPRASFEYSFAASGNVMRDAEDLRRRFLEARAYRERIVQSRAGAGGSVPPPAPAGDENLDTLLDVLEGRLPLSVRADTENGILAALAIQDEFHVRLVLVGCGGIGGMVGEILARKIPVVLDAGAILAAGTDEIGAVRTLLAKGIPVAVGSGEKVSMEFFRYVLLRLVQAGLTKPDVLDMASVEAAKILSLGDRTGDLAPGKDADFVVLSGDPFDLATRVEQVFVGGRKVFGQ